MKRILITGASRGIGAATALLASRQGYMVVINYLKNTGAAQQIVAQIESAGGKVVAVQADVSDEKGIQRLFEETDRLAGGLDALVNNAGINMKKRFY